MRDPPDPAQDHATEGNEIRNARKHAVGVHGEGIPGEVRAIPELFKGNAGQQEHRSATYLVHAIDVFDVLAGVVANALLRFGDQFIALAELGRAGRADFGTGGRLSRLHAVGTHRALLHARQKLAPFVFRHTEWTGHHAIAAAHAAVLVVDDRPGRRLPQRAHRAHGRTCWVATVHA